MSTPTVQTTVKPRGRRKDKHRTPNTAVALTTALKLALREWWADARHR